MELVYGPVTAAVLGLYRWHGWRLHVTGAEHVPAAGGAVVASNHVSYLDFTMIGLATRTRGRLPRFLAKKELFDHAVAGPLLRGMRHVEVDRYADPQAAYAAGVAALRRGELLGTFPEGTISRSLTPARGKTGAARLALEADVPLVPCGVWGGQRLHTKGRSRSWTRGVPLHVTFGAPVHREVGEGARAVTDRLMARVGALVEELAADYPARPTGQDDGWWLPAHLGGTAPTVEESDAAAREAESARRVRDAARRRSRGEPGSPLPS